MKIAFNGLLIDKKRAGIGQYGYNLIQSLTHKTNIDYTFFLQNHIRFNYKNVVYRKDYKNPYERMFDEQLIMPFKYPKFDLVHFIDYSSPIMPIKTPFITTIHDLTFYKYPETFTKKSRKIKQTLTPISINRAAAIIAVSESTKKDIIEYFPQVEDKIKVIYPGKPDFKRIYDKEHIEYIKKIYGIEGNYILAVGTLEPRKNIVSLLKAFEKIYKKIKDIKLVLVGNKGWLYEDIFTQASAAECFKNIVYTGYVDQEHITTLYSGAQMFVYPSLYEGFGLPPLEAMCCGVPVVVSNTSSLPEVVGDAGVYCNPHSVDSISEAILRVLNNNELRKELTYKGLKQCEKFSWEKTADSIIDLYGQIAEVQK
ncbi:glycosyltransferase family 1 protein [Clostridium sp. DJ247]|uniref:glycosyltransferase family 4 protein n=1 Tax=Clostridium sp. DJ247 TaxID=2726188 RepID=UPI00162ADAB8|nr:glycosyltransferase family 1 protein [Clostridium sp. DJ247]MBC2581567.1 glycosyltransferase family 4 protein [Clostridium sp. DJ247]